MRLVYGSMCQRVHLSTLIVHMYIPFLLFNCTCLSCFWVQNSSIHTNRVKSHKISCMYIVFWVYVVVVVVVVISEWTSLHSTAHSHKYINVRVVCVCRTICLIYHHIQLDPDLFLFISFCFLPIFNYYNYLVVVVVVVVVYFRLIFNFS